MGTKVWDTDHWEGPADGVDILELLFEQKIHSWHPPRTRSAWTANVIAGNFYRADFSPAGTTPGYLEWVMWLPTGTYQCLVQALQHSSYGIGSVSIDGNTFGNYDLYLAGGGIQLVDYWLATSRAVTAGLHTIRLTKSGTKSASATDYYVNMHEITLVRY